MIGGRGKAEAQRAMDRGRALGLEDVAVYLAGEEVRCPGPPSEPVCGGFLFLRGQTGPVHVRCVEDRRTGERRATLRDTDRRHGDTYRCPKQDHHRLDVQGQVTVQPATGAA